MSEVKILPQYCKGCAYCVASCPKKVLAIGESINALGYKYAEAADPEKCTACKICATVCPDSAIEIYK